MAILKDLIVHGSSRFLNKIYASEIQTPLIEAEAGIIKKLKADDATVVGLLDVKGQLHTSSWSNSNIATIDGSFYITPTIESASGTVSIIASSLTFSGTNYAVSSLYLGDGSSITWPQYSKVLVTGQVLLNGEWIPLGTLLGQLSSAATATSISINNIKDNKKPPSNTSNVYTALVNSGISSTDYRNLKVSLYQRATSSTDFRPLGIYMTATGTNGRTFLDIYGGVESLSNSNNYGGFAEPNVRIGNLQGLPNVGGQTPSGWGIYTDNGYFKGIIAADQGYIGSGSKYWVIANEEDLSNSENSRSYIYNGTNNIASTVEGIYLGTDGIRNYKNSTHHVTIKNGVITALGVNLTGEITASSGSIGGWNIGTDTNKSLYYGNQTPGATTTNLILSPTSATNSNAIGGSGTGLTWFISAGKVFGVTTAGALYTTSGKIGGWTLNSDGFYITNSIPGYNANTLIFSKGTASTNAIGGSDTTSKNWMISAGTGFGVTTTGALYANDAHISGEITATSGTIGGIRIVNGDLDVSSISIGSLNGANNYAQKTDVTNAIDSLQIGGRNLLRYNVKNYAFSESKIVEGTTYRGMYAPIEEGKTYTISRKIIESNRFRLYTTQTEPAPNVAAQPLKVNDDSLLKYTFIAPSNANYLFMYLSNQSDNISDGNIKLEIGNKATDWTPAPEDVEADVNDARKTATSYITQINNTGIKITPYDKSGNNYLQINSDAISMYRNNIETLKIEDSAIRIGKIGEGQKNVYIDNNSIDIRNNENVLANFTGENIKFYDGEIGGLEIASFGGANGVRIGNEEETHFVINNSAVKALNNNGSPIFSIETTDTLIGNTVKIASGAIVPDAGGSITLSTDSSSLSLESNDKFYIEQIVLILDVAASVLDEDGIICQNFQVNQTNQDIGRLNYRTKSYVGGFTTTSKFISHLFISSDTFTYGITSSLIYNLSGTFSCDSASQISYSGQIRIEYDGNNTLTFNSLVNSSSFGDNRFTLESSSHYSYSDIMVIDKTSYAPALTFGTRLGTIGPLSTVIGEALYAPGNGQMTIGKFNYGQDTQTSTYSFIVGNGQDDTDRSNAFTVDWNGNVGIQGKIHNIIISGGTETKLPLFHFEGKTWTISSIGAKGAWYEPSGNDRPLTRSINVPGYTAIAIAGYSVWGGTNAGWCVVPRVYIDRNLTDNYGNPTDDMLQMYIWNQGSQAAKNVKFTVEILYIANNFID